MQSGIGNNTTQPRKPGIKKTGGICLQPGYFCTTGLNTLHIKEHKTTQKTTTQAQFRERWYMTITGIIRQQSKPEKLDKAATADRQHARNAILTLRSFPQAVSIKTLAALAAKATYQLALIGLTMFQY
ncbi:hypothetical protein [Oceanicoccus sp. KOV_DT_Chl]|uniref:hypothetical protein n=1 Tax=Oceanicoccus sp. KOV_DT_Chl TaxID=1904639 RepID=UPI000C7B705A|nr:hypothetical protein [Oceanicoccus sp. KOV_DT_Chl]